MKIFAKRLPNTSYGTIAQTGERCVMQSNGFWVGAGGIHITSYHRLDKPDYNDKGERVFRQYSMDRAHRFYVETEDPWDDNYADYIYE